MMLRPELRLEHRILDALACMAVLSALGLHTG